MDYSAAIADDPTGPSPWGSSSPRAQRTPFTGATPDSPTTPPQSGHAPSESQSTLGEPALPPPQTSSVDAQQQEQVAKGESLESQQHPESHAQPQSAQQQQPQPGQQRSSAARYHNARPQRPVPQYKLQAKVTALERTGRKDPVLRFDVYVSKLKKERKDLF